MHGIEVLTLY